MCEYLDNGPNIHVDLALIHYPVCNKNNETIGSAVTNLDIHDIARAGTTFGVSNFYIITPYKDQQQLVQEIVDHWLIGHGAWYNSDRKEALSSVRICDDLESLVDRVREQGGKPIFLATCARKHENSWPYQEVRERIFKGEHIVICFGTGWGLTSEVLESMDGLLPPILGFTEYNHLSVRSAAAIVLDRLLAVV